MLHLANGFDDVYTLEEEVVTYEDIDNPTVKREIEKVVKAQRGE